MNRTLDAAGLGQFRAPLEALACTSLDALAAIDNTTLLSPAVGMRQLHVNKLRRQIAIDTGAAAPAPPVEKDAAAAAPSAPVVVLPGGGSPDPAVEVRTFRRHLKDASNAHSFGGDYRGGLWAWPCS